MKALILAAGKGTRLKSLTVDRPKPMLPVGAEPLLAHHIRRLRDAGVEEIAINLHHAPEVITEYFGDGSRFDVRLTYSFEPELLGTAGAAKILEWFLDEPYFVVYGDVFTNIDLADLARFHAVSKAQTNSAMALTMSLYRVPNPTECGLVELDAVGRVLRFVEKPPADQVFTDLANAGILVCDPEVMGVTPAAQVFDFGRDLIPLLLERDSGVFGKPIAAEEYVIDIGTPAGFERAQLLANGQRLSV
jgi:mannose-1-phosphate guanylyltransferase